MFFRQNLINYAPNRRINKQCLDFYFFTQFNCQTNKSKITLLMFDSY